VRDGQGYDIVRTGYTFYKESTLESADLLEIIERQVICPYMSSNCAGVAEYLSPRAFTNALVPSIRNAYCRNNYRSAKTSMRSRIKK